MPADDTETGKPMSNGNKPGPWTFFREGKLRWVVLAIALALVAVIVVLLIVGGRQNGDLTSGASSDPTTSKSPSSESGSPSPSSSPSPSPSGSPVEPDTDDGPAPQPTKDPIGFDQKADVNPALTVLVSNLEAVDGEAQGPGEIAGRAIRVTLTITNSTTDEIDLSTAVTTVSYGVDEIPAQELSGPGKVTLPTEISGNSTATAVLVFSVPAEERNLVSVAFDYSVDVPVIVFQGAVPQ